MRVCVREHITFFPIVYFNHMHTYKTMFTCVYLFSFNIWFMGQLWHNMIFINLWNNHFLFNIFFLSLSFFFKLRARIVQIQWTAPASKSIPFVRKEVRANLWWLKRPKIRLMMELENFATNPNMRMWSPLLIRPRAILRLSECIG